MKYFIYKTFVVFAFIFITYYATIGRQINILKIEINNILDKDKIEFIKIKIKNELKNSLKKERIISPEDASLIKQFINKINNELK